MAVSLGSNIIGLRTQRALASATDQLSTSMSRLASGMRINSAADDAAGLSIAERLRTDTRLYSQAVRNVNDGLSALNIVDSALGSQGSIIDRLRELATQSANGTLSNTQRRSLNAEYQELVREYGRIGDTTSFNSVALMRAGIGNNVSHLNLQAGIDGGRNSQLSFNLSNTGSFSGVVDFSDINWFDYGYTYSFSDLNNFFKGQLATTSVTDSNGVKHDLMIGLSKSENFGAQYSFVVLARAAELPGYGVSTNDVWAEAARFDADFDPATGKITIPEFDAALSGFAGGATASLHVDLRGITISDRTSNQYSINAGYNTSIDFTNVLDQSYARVAMDTLARAQTNLLQYRGTVGAIQQRLSTTLAVLKTSSENVAAAESRIRDVDVATESAAMIASSIRQKVAASLLTQANAAPRLALQLLG